MHEQKTITIFTLLLFATWVALSTITVSGKADAALILEGQLFARGEKIAAGEPVEMTVRIFDDEFAGTLLFAESQEIKAGAQFSAFTFEKGEVTVKKRFSGTPADNLWIEVEYDGQIMSPRLSLAELGSLNELKAEDLTIRQTHLRTAGPATLIIDDNGVTLSGLLDMGSNSIKLGGESRNQWLESRVATLENDVADLKSLLQHFSRSNNEITISGANLHIINGTGSTDGATNSLGNLIVGYNEDSTTTSGSHNIVVGTQNKYSSYGGLVVGTNNTISGAYASVSGGSNNIASGTGASVSGGSSNTASSTDASISGGLGNTASGPDSCVSGGWNNTASGFESSVSGGRNNTASSNYATSVSGGRDNTANGYYTSISGGYKNTTSSNYTNVSGGYNNNANGDYASISGGYGNNASGQQSNISGGFNNSASGSNACVSGGNSNTASGDSASVTGGRYNKASGSYSVVVGGGGATDITDTNEAFADYSAILGGQANLAGDAAKSDHSIGTMSTVSGGVKNQATGYYASVSGGRENVASGAKATVSGGKERTASGEFDWAAGDLWRDM